MRGIAAKQAKDMADIKIPYSIKYTEIKKKG